MHWMFGAGAILTQASGDGQSPPHVGGLLPAICPHGLVVVVVGGGVVVVVVPCRILSTGTQSIFGLPTVTSSVWNWSIKVAAIAGGTGGKRPVSLLQSKSLVPATGVHCFTLIL